MGHGTGMGHKEEPESQLRRQGHSLGLAFYKGNETGQELGAAKFLIHVFQHCLSLRGLILLWGTFPLFLFQRVAKPSRSGGL